MQQHFPEREMPKEKKARQRLHKEVDETLLEDPAFALLHEQFKTKISLAQELIQSAIERDLPFETVLMDSWYLSEGLVKTLAGKKNWVSLLKKNRNVESHSFTLRDADGEVIKFSKPHIKIEDLVPLIPKHSYKKVTISDKSYWCFSLKVRVSSLGTVRIVISYDNADLSGTYAILITRVLCFGTQAHVMRLPRLFVAWQTAWRTPLLLTPPAARGHARRGSRLQSRLLLAADTPPQWF